MELIIKQLQRRNSIMAYPSSNQYFSFICSRVRVWVYNLFIYSENLRILVSTQQKVICLCFIILIYYSVFTVLDVRFLHTRFRATMSYTRRSIGLSDNVRLQLHRSVNLYSYRKSSAKLEASLVAAVTDPYHKSL